MPSERTDCPSCGARGRRVPPVTLASLVTEGTPIGDGRYRFCRTQGCEVAYFSELGHPSIRVGSLRVRVGQKESAPDRPVCYCFGHSAADIVAEVQSTGGSTIPEVITERCHRGEQRCPETNPQGSCCLGNVRAVLAEAKAQPVEAPSCCSCSSG